MKAFGGGVISSVSRFLIRLSFWCCAALTRTRHEHEMARGFHGRSYSERYRAEQSGRESERGEEKEKTRGLSVSRNGICVFALLFSSPPGSVGLWACSVVFLCEGRVVLLSWWEREGEREW